MPFDHPGRQDRSGHRLMGKAQRNEAMTNQEFPAALDHFPVAIRTRLISPLPEGDRLPKDFPTFSYLTYLFHTHLLLISSREYYC